jgi:hypothetical protein
MLMSLSFTNQAVLFKETLHYGKNLEAFELGYVETNLGNHWFLHIRLYSCLWVPSVLYDSVLLQNLVDKMTNLHIHVIQFSPQYVNQILGVLPYSLEWLQVIY